MPRRITEKEPLGIWISLFLVFCLGIVAFIVLEIPDAIHTFMLTSPDENSEATARALLFTGLLIPLMCGLSISALFLLIRHKNALVLTRCSLTYGIALTPLFFVSFVIIWQTTAAELVAAYTSMALSLSLYCFVKKWNFSGLMLVCATGIALFMVTGSFKGIFLLLDASSVYVSLIFFLPLYYFTHSRHAQRILCSK